MKKTILITTLLTISTYSFADMKQCLLSASQDNNEKTIEYCTPYLKDKENPEATAILASIQKDNKITLDYLNWYVQFYSNQLPTPKTHTYKSYTSSLFTIGNIYYAGEAGKPDKTKGLKYITKSANLGNDYAQKQLGGMYASGQNGDIQANFSTGYKWTEIAIANGSEEAKNSYMMVNFESFKSEYPYCLAMGEQLVAQAYIDGSAGLPKDKSKAKKYLTDAIALYKDNEPTKENLKYCPEQKGLDLDGAEKLLGSL